MHSNVSQRDTVVVIFYNSVLLVEQLVSTLGDNVIYVNFVQFDIDSMSLGVEGTWMRLQSTFEDLCYSVSAEACPKLLSHLLPQCEIIFFSVS